MYYLIVIGLIGLSFIGIYLWRRQAYHIPNPSEGEGEVVDMETITLPGINPINLLRGKRETVVKFHPVVRFKLDQEKRVRFRNRKGYSDEERFKVGDKVRVLYSRDNPLVAKIKE